jgi:hypothetical protein
VSPLEKLTALGAVAGALAGIWFKLKKIRAVGRAELADAARDAQKALNESAVRRAKTTQCKLCRKATFPSAVEGICSQCWSEGRARGMFQ